MRWKLAIGIVPPIALIMTHVALLSWLVSASIHVRTSNRWTADGLQGRGQNFYSLAYWDLMALLRLAIATYDVTIIATSRPCRNVFRRDNLRFEGDFPVASRCVPPEHIVPGTVILPARRFTTVWYLQILLFQAERI